MAQLSTLSPSLFSTLVEQVKLGHLRPANLVANVQAGITYSYHDNSARFDKDSPGHYSVAFKTSGNQVAKEDASSPVEAKLMVLDWLTKAA